MRTLELKLPDEIAKLLLSLPVKAEDFIIDSLKKSLADLKNKRKKDFLAEGYKASKKEARLLLKDFDHIDIENWDDY